MMGIDPKQMAEMQKVSGLITAKIVIDQNEPSVKLSMSSDNPQAIELIPGLISQFADALAMQLSSFFAIKGKITEIKKGD